MAANQAMLEKEVGDLLHRRRAVSEMLYGGRPYEHAAYDSEENCYWYGSLKVERNSKGDLSVTDPDGYVMAPVEVPDGPQDEVIETVTERLDIRLSEWTKNL